jgi:acyl-CoA synthetase (AMP-forming)/AMP-acid ligase II
MRFLFPETKIFSMYGQTECKRISYLPPDQIDIRTDSVGIAIPNTEVTVVDERGERVGPGVVGELVVRGAHVMQGYWEKEEETKRALRPWHLSGEKVLYTRDLFKTDAEGFLYFVGRQDDIIKTRGEKVSPKEVERVLCALPEVAEAAVIGVPDPVLGHVIKALIVLTSGGSLTPEAVLLHCKQNLEAFMIPKFVVFLEALPKTEMGKIKKGELS